MPKYYFLGQAAGFSRRERLKHTFAFGKKKDLKNLSSYLEKRYHGSVALTKNGRSALAIAMINLLEPGSKVIINGFTCHAVCEALAAAKMVPVYADIDEKSLNFTPETIKKVLEKDVKAIIVQNTLGNPADIAAIEKIAKTNNLVIIEDLAHCAGRKYQDGREMGTVGDATALSFGKEKVVDTISGGAVILRGKKIIGAPSKAPKFRDLFRARFYPHYGATYRALTRIKLGAPYMWLLLKLHLVERSADNKLDLTRRIGCFEAKLALEKLQKLDDSTPVRDFALVENRDKVLEKLRAMHYLFDGFWYERPISPARYYKSVNFPEKDCPVAVKVSKEIINFPSYYSAAELEPARKIVNQYQREAK